jgi:hypothetical protein
MRDHENSLNMVQELNVPMEEQDLPTVHMIDLRPTGFAHIGADSMRSLLRARDLSDFAAFARSWNHLGHDHYMADGGRYRRRRHACFQVSPSTVTQKPHRSHYQSRNYNPLNGGIERWFEQIEPEIASSPFLHAVLKSAADLFANSADEFCAAWHVEVHQIRTETDFLSIGLPTPEGLHQDGVDWACAMLIDRVNVDEGVTHIHDGAKRHIASFCLTEPLETALVDDRRVYHAVTPIVPVDPQLPAHRDVLVATFKASNSTEHAI